ncbi:hypothetical protein ACBJ59_54470 [Nonomuraea sp. MTCD27]|uniref:hypothetical protein n=1 Tax=Nonomuraea sp. MTCD27 TaxID=1676747 RepID=UPI0035BF9121
MLEARGLGKSFGQSAGFPPFATGARDPSADKNMLSMALHRKIGPEIRAHLSPLQWEHITFHGTYPFNRPGSSGRLRDLHDPAADDPEL